MSEPMPDFLSALFRPDARTPEQRKCDHLLMGKMPDGKFFCPSCNLVTGSKP